MSEKYNKYHESLDIDCRDKEINKPKVKNNCCCDGYYEANDGGDSTYKITSTESQTEYQEELDNGLYTTLIVDNGVLKNRTAIPTSTTLRIGTLYYVDVNMI